MRKSDKFFYNLSCLSLVIAVFVAGITIGVNIC